MNKTTVQIRIRGAIAQTITEWHSKTGMSLSEVGQLYLSFAQDSIGTKESPSKLLRALETRVGWANITSQTAPAAIVTAPKLPTVKKPSKRKK